jgi:hypothetical protein
VFWGPIVVGLAYLPDIASQMAVLVGLAGAHVVTHSVLFALLAALGAAVVLARLGLMPGWYAFGLSLLCFVLHDVLDLLETTTWRPWWPLGVRLTGLHQEVIPVNSYQEALLFGTAFGAFALGRWLVRRWRHRVETSPSAEAPPNRGAVWASRALMLTILLCACGSHYLRSVRERDLGEVYRLLASRQYAAALQASERAARWPCPAKPGQLDYVRAEAYRGLGDYHRAEEHYLRSCQADPSYFWTVADLAIFYASSDQPRETRRRQVVPYVDKLRKEFAQEPYLPRVLSRIERRLSQGRP